MDLGLDKAKLAAYKAQVTRLLGDPLKMRLAVVVGITGLAIGAVYLPLTDRIDQRRAQVAAEVKRFETIKDVEGLRHEVAQYRPRVSENGDTNDWVQYLLGGLRETKARLRDMEIKEPRNVGPYRAIALVVEVEGTYPQLKQFVEWLDQSERLLRIDGVRFERMPTGIGMKVTILGLVPKHA
jgi:hypothetical protein